MLIVADWFFAPTSSLNITVYTLSLFHLSFVNVCSPNRLGESIAASNSYRHQEAEHIPKRSHVQAATTCVNSMKSSIVCPPNEDAATFNIQDLIQKLQSGLEVNGFFNIYLLG